VVHGPPVKNLCSIGNAFATKGNLEINNINIFGHKEGQFLQSSFSTKDKLKVFGKTAPKHGSHHKILFQNFSEKVSEKRTISFAHFLRWSI